MNKFTLRPQPDIEQRLYQIIEGLPAVDRNNAERVSWHCGQLVALLYALGASEQRAIATMYQLWRTRHQTPEIQADYLAAMADDSAQPF